jgi:AcrR family transcriptional regulator/DNA-binding MarR family transcriptional regulator
MAAPTDRRSASSGGATAARRGAVKRALPGEGRLARRREQRVSSRGAPRVQVEEIQHSRLLVAVAATIDELGFEQSTVTRIAARAKVSRRTFYELFENRETCLVALIDAVVERVERDLEAVGLEGLEWRERVRGGLWTILSFLEREPLLARIWVVHALHGGPQTLERREQVLARLAAILDEGRHEGPRGAECTLVTAEGLVGGALGVVYARLRSGDRRPLTDLLDELMGMIALQYLGPRAARREQRRPAPMPPPVAHSARPSMGTEHDPLDEVNMRLTYRTARVLQGVREHPGASNREIANCAGISDPGQVSKLLRRLEGLGLLENHGLGHAQGERNEWKLTPLGGQVAQRLSVITGDRSTNRGASVPLTSF